jgi:hypothetical protein
MAKIPLSIQRIKAMSISNRSEFTKDIFERDRSGEIISGCRAKRRL